MRNLGEYLRAYWTYVSTNVGWGKALGFALLWLAGMFVPLGSKDARTAAGLAGDNLDGWLGAARLCFCALRHVETPPRSDCEPKSARPKIVDGHITPVSMHLLSATTSGVLYRRHGYTSRAPGSLNALRQLRKETINSGQTTAHRPTPRHIGDSHKTYYGIFYCGRISLKCKGLRPDAGPVVEPAASRTP